jgi:hypothetical protein
MTDNGFPTDVFPKFIQQYIEDLNQSLNFHKDFLSAAVIFSVATIMGNRYKLRVKSGWDAAPIFWFACVGFPGTIKTHPIKTMVRPIIKLDKESKAIYDEEIKHYDDQAKPRQTKPKFKQILISDYTIEALHQVHNINTRGLGLYKDELNGFLKDMNKYRKGSDLEFWLESFNNGSYIVNRVTREPVLIDDICINIIGTIQHEVLTDVIGEYSGNGFIDRFLFTSPESQVFELNENEADEALAELWERFIQNSNKLCRYFDHNNTEIIRMDKSAFKKYQEIDAKFVEIQRDQDKESAIKNYISKMKTYVPRFALVLAVINNTSDYIFVSEKEMTDAGKIADYFISNAQDIFSGNSIQREIRSIIKGLRTMTRNEQIEHLSMKGFKKADLGRYFGVSRQMIGKILSATS